MKLLLFTFMVFLLLVQTNSRLTIQYDKFKDRTVVSLREMPLGKGAIDPRANPSTASAQLDLTLMHVYQGRKTPRLSADDQLFAVISSKDLLVLTSPPRIVLLMDGKRETLESDALLDIPDLGKGRQVKVPVTVELLERVIKSKSAEGRLDHTEFYLSSRNKQEMAKFLKSVALPSRSAEGAR